MRALARLLPALATVAAMTFAGSNAWADPARDAILADLTTQAKAEDAAFNGFSAERGQAFFLAKQTTGDPTSNACAVCHGSDPKRPGENVKTGKAIEPMAVSINPARYTNADDVEKWFRRNCKEVLGRECTAIEKGDFIAFMAAQ